MGAEHWCLKEAVMRGLASKIITIHDWQDPGRLQREQADQKIKQYPPSYVLYCFVHVE